MIKLISKEFKLALHPTCIIFLSLSLMLVIPNYPYYVTFFYTGLAIFFTCLSGRENNDIYYMMLLPIRKRDIVKARFLMAIIIEFLQVLVAIPVAILRNYTNPAGNTVGMDANIAFFGFTFVLLGLFNYTFFTKYYKDTDKVGMSFLLGSTVVFLYIIFAEAAAHAIPFVRDYLDTKDPNFVSAKLIVLAVGVLIYIVLNFAAYNKSVKSFEKLDL